MPWLNLRNITSSMKYVTRTLVAWRWSGTGVTDSNLSTNGCLLPSPRSVHNITLLSHKSRCWLRNSEGTLSQNSALQMITTQGSCCMVRYGFTVYLQVQSSEPGKPGHLPVRGVQLQVLWALLDLSDILTLPGCLQTLGTPSNLLPWQYSVSLKIHYICIVRGCSHIMSTTKWGGRQKLIFFWLCREVFSSISDFYLDFSKWPGFWVLTIFCFDYIQNQGW